MNGPDHYREAERLIEDANHVGHSDPQRGDGMLAAAQVHATLALAAATAVCSPAMFRDGPPDQDLVAWQEVAGGANEPVSSEPGQVDPEPAAPVRIDSLFGQIAQGDVSVSHPAWDDGEPVQLVEINLTTDGIAKVVYRETYGLFDTTVFVAPDTLVTPVGGA